METPEIIDLADWRQGDLLKSADRRSPLFTSTASSGFVIVSQTCDVVLPKRPTISLAPLRRLSPEEANAARLENPRYVGWSTADLTDVHVDLADIQTLKKTVIGHEVVRIPAGIAQSEKVRLAVGRWFGRFAFPDDVQRLLSPLESIVRSKYQKDQSPLGQLLQSVVEFRVQSNDWNAPVQELTIHVVVEAGLMPDLEISSFNGEANDRREVRALSDIAVQLRQASHLSLDEQRSLWNEFAESIRELCTGPNSSMTNADQVVAVDVQLWSDDEFPLSLVRKTERLDLDYLSPL